MDLAEFLLARIAEDEATARKVEKANGGAWAALPVGLLGLARWTPARVLAECEAKRRIVEIWQRLEAEDTREFVVGGGWEPGIGYASDALEHAMRALAAPYAAHPDYRPGWAPTARV